MVFFSLDEDDLVFLSSTLVREEDEEGSPLMGSSCDCVFLDFVFSTEKSEGVGVAPFDDDFFSLVDLEFLDFFFFISCSFFSSSSVELMILSGDDWTELTTD